MKYKVLGGRWGEGYEVGQIIDIDLDAARVRLQLGELEEVKESVGKVEKVQSEPKMKEEEVVSAASPEIVSHETKEEEKPRRGRPKKA